MKTKTSGGYACRDRSAVACDGADDCSRRAHRKDHRFSRRSVSESSAMVMKRMQTEIAAPSGQS